MVIMGAPATATQPGWTSSLRGSGWRPLQEPFPFAGLVTPDQGGPQQESDTAGQLLEAAAGAAPGCRTSRPGPSGPRVTWSHCGGGWRQWQELSGSLDLSSRKRVGPDRTRMLCDDFWRPL